MTPHLQCRGLTCEIGGRTIVSGVDLDVPRGSMVALVGPNGSGKSTLIRSLVGLRPAAAGHVHVGGTDLAEISSRQRAKLLAHVGQEEGPTEDLLVGEMVALGRVPHRQPWSLDASSERPLVMEALEMVGMADFADRPCQHLSGGERRRVMLARGIAQGSELLVLDEPTNHLDVHHQIQLMETIRGLGRTVLAAVHDLPLAAAHFDRVAVLHEGGLLAVGEPAEVLDPQVLRTVFGVRATHLVDPATGRVHLVLGAGAPAPAERFAS